MADLLEQTPDDEGFPEKRSMPMRKDIGMEEVIRKLKGALANREPNAVVQIESTEPENPISVNLPASVAKIVLRELEKETAASPTETLLKEYRKWEAGDTEFEGIFHKGWVDCFSVSSDANLFWTLQHFSDPDFPLSGEQKSDLKFHTHMHASTHLSDVISQLSSTENTDSFEYCWYVLVRLMAIGESLASKNQENPLIANHRELIHAHYCLLLRALRESHQMGWINVISTKDAIEEKLFGLIKSHPKLRPQVTHILQNLEDMEHEGDMLEQAQIERSQRMEDESEMTDVVKNTEAQKKLARKLLSLERAITPEMEDDPAWHHPLDYLESISEGRRFVFINNGMKVPRGEDFSNGQKFDFALLTRLAEQGFLHWLYTNTAGLLRRSIHPWLIEQGDSRSLASLCQSLQEYMELRRGNRIPPLREYLGLPLDAPESLQVTQTIRYCQEMWERKEQHHAELKLLTVEFDNERAMAFDWLRASAQKKILCLDEGNFHESVFGMDEKNRQTSVLVEHRTATPQYDYEKFLIHSGMSHAAFNVGRKKGWGEYQSAALPIKGNRKLLESFAAGGDLAEELRTLQTSGYALHLGKDYIDAAIFTSEGEEENKEEIWDPSEVYDDAPLVGSHR